MTGERLREISMNGITIDERWMKIRDVIHTSAVETLGYEKKRNQDWFDENDTHIAEVINKKRKTLQDMQANPQSSSHKEAFKQAKSECQRHLRKRQNDWWTDKANRVVHIGETLEPSVRKLKSYMDLSNGILDVSSRNNGAVVDEPDRVVEIWGEYFKQLLNMEP